MSGRRCSSCDGTPEGTAGTCSRASSTGAITKLLGVTPTSTAIACCNTARCATTPVSSAWVAASWLRARATSSPEAILPASRNDVMSTAFW